MSIRQINATYTPDEDRILLRVTLTEGDELRFWLTRASLREFLPRMQSWMAGENQAGAHAATPDGRASCVKQAFQREAAAARCDLSQPLVPGERLPWGERPALVTRVSLETDNGPERILLHLADARLATLNLDADILPGILRLMRQIIAGADWGYAVSSGEEGSMGGAIH